MKQPTRHSEQEGSGSGRFPRLLLPDSGGNDGRLVTSPWEIALPPPRFIIIQAQQRRDSRERERWNKEWWRKERERKRERKMKRRTTIPNPLRARAPEERERERIEEIEKIKTTTRKEGHTFFSYLFFFSTLVCLLVVDTRKEE